MSDKEFLEELESVIERHPEISEEVLVEAPELLAEFNRKFAIAGRVCVRTAKNPRTGKVYCIEWSDQ